jgi:hypothetical protein
LQLIVVKTPIPDTIAAALVVPERVLLFCLASDTDWTKAGVPPIETSSSTPPVNPLDVIVHGNVERAGDRDDLLGHLDVRARRRRVATWVIVDQSTARFIALSSRAFSGNETAILPMAN